MAGPSPAQRRRGKQVGMGAGARQQRDWVSIVLEDREIRLLAGCQCESGGKGLHSQGGQAQLY